jgi:hypothetical protein
MHEAEGVNFKVGVAGESKGPQPKPGARKGYRHNNPNLEDIVSFIARLSLSDSERQELVKVASKMPHGALARFRENYMNYLGKRGQA